MRSADRQYVRELVRAECNQVRTDITAYVNSEVGALRDETAELADAIEARITYVHSRALRALTAALERKPTA